MLFRSPAAAPHAPALRLPGRRGVAASQADRTAPAPSSPRTRRIAIVGISGQYPGAVDLDAFWDNLRQGRDSVDEIPGNRWSLDGFYEPDEHAAVAAGKSYCKRGGFLDRFAEFDPLFFGIAPREALNMDPQERLFLQTAWNALENAGLTREALRRRFDRRVGVFAGITRAGYNLYRADADPAVKFWPRTSFGSVANRLSYLLDIEGPSLPVDTMCSSSLTALHEACEHILNGDCRAAIAGGVNLFLHPTSYIDMSSQHMLSKDGRCRSFGEGANGFVPGEGVGVVVLRPLEDAERDGDVIHGVIIATGINHGGKTNGYTVPNPTAQAALVREAIDRAGIDAGAIGYIEAHGTGTDLGDPIEIAGLEQAFAPDAVEPGHCAIGSVKSNIGHLEAAAGIAGLTKVLLQFRHGQIAPSLHAERTNPNIRFERTPFALNRTLTPWARPVVDGVAQARIAGVSSFGAGGANAHVLVEEHLPASGHGAAALDVSPRTGVFPVSAKTPEQLRQRARDLLDALRDGRVAGGCAEVAHTLQTGREAMEARACFLAPDLATLATRLEAFVGDAGVRDGIFVARQDGAAAPASTRRAIDPAVVEGWLARGETDELARAWVDGAAIDWAAPWQGSGVRRVELPGYPFAREAFWIDDVVRPAGAQDRPQPQPPGDLQRAAAIIDGIDAAAIAPEQGVRLLRALLGNPA